MSTVREIEAAVQRLSPEQLAELREWLLDYFEDNLELTDQERRKLDTWADKERADGRTKVFESPAAYAANVRAKRSRKTR